MFSEIELKYIITTAYDNKYKCKLSLFSMLFKIKLLYVNYNYTYIVFKYKHCIYEFRSLWYYKRLYCGEETIKQIINNC